MSGAAPDVDQNFLLRSRSWPAASPSAPVSPPWSLWPVWTLAPRCPAARPAAVPPPPPEDRRCIAASESRPRKPCCCGSGSSATSRRAPSGCRAGGPRFPVEPSPVSFRAGCTLNVKDFKTSWRSGVVFLAILYALRPEVVDLSKARTRSNKQNLEEAFRVAESELRIPKLLDPDGEPTSSFPSIHTRLVFLRAPKTHTCTTFTTSEELVEI